MMKSAAWSRLTDVDAATGGSAASSTVGGDAVKAGVARGVGGGATAVGAAVVVVGVVTAEVATEVWGPVVVSLTDDASGERC